MQEYDDIIRKFTSSSEQPPQQKLAEARQRTEDKLRKRLENSPYAPYVPPPQSQQPTPSEWDKYRGIGFAKYDHNPFNVFDKVPNPSLWKQSKDFAKDNLASVNQGIHNVVKTGATVADIAGQVLLTNPKNIINDGLANAEIRLLPKQEEAYTTQLLNLLGYKPNEHIQALEQTKSLNYHETKKKIDEEIEKNTGIKKLATAFWQTVKHPSVGIPMGVESIPEMVVTGGSRLGVGVTEALQTTIHQLSEMIENDLDIDKKSATALAVNAVVTKVLGDSFKTDVAVDDIISKAVNPANKTATNTSIKQTVKELGKETLQEMGQEASDNATHQFIHTGNINADEVLASAGQGGAIGTHLSGIPAVANLLVNAGTNTPSIDNPLKQVPIDRLLDPKDKKFDPAKAFSRAYELSINGETKEQKDTAKEQMDKAKSWVYDKLAEIDETIATTSTPEKLEKLHKQKELLQSKYIEPIENIIKAGNNASLATDSPLRPTDDGFVQDVLKNQEEIIAKFNSDNLNYGVTLPPMPSVPSVPEQEPLAVNPEQPTQSQPVNNNTSFNSNLTQATFFGDSIAVGYKQSYGANQGIVKGGKDTRWILNSIKDYVTKNPNSLQGQTVVLSSGYSNTSFGTDYKGRTTKNQRQTALANIKNQISTLKNAGANVVLLGVADNYNLYGGNGSQMNADLASLAKEQGVYFTGGLGNAKDRVHPNYPKNKIKLPNTNTTTQQNNQPAITKNSQTYQYNKKANRKTNAIGMAGNWNSGNIGNMSDATTRRFVASVLYNESAGGNINAVQPTGAYIGKYQLGAGWLVDAGYMSRSAYIKAGLDKMSGAKSANQGIAKAFLRNKNNWLNGLSYEAFMASHEHQDRAFKIGTENNYNELKRKGLLKGRSELEIAGLLKAAHLGGIGGATKVAKGLKAGKDFTGTSVAGYYNSIVQNTDGLGNQSIAYNGGVSNSDDSAVSTINQNTELDNTQEELNRLLAQWEQDDTNEALQDEIAKLQTKVEELSQKQNQEQIQTQTQQQLDDLKAQTLPKLVIRYSQMASEQALDEINQLQQSGMLDEAQADNLRRLIDVKIAIKGTNQDDVNHQITKGRRGNTNQETNLGLEDYDKVFTSAIAGHTPDTKTITRYSRLLDNFSQSHHNKAQAMQEAYQSVRGTANSVYLIPTQTDNGVEWQRGSLDDFNKAKQQDAYPLQIHSGSGQFVDSVVQEALRIDGFKTAWADSLAMLTDGIQPTLKTNKPSKASKISDDVNVDTNTVNVGRAGTGVNTVNLSNVNRGTAQAGQDGWLGNPFNIGAKGGWGVNNAKEQQNNYANLLIQVLKQNEQARKEFIKLQDKQLNSNYGEAEVIGGLLKAFKGKDDSQIQTLLNNYQGYDNDSNSFDFSPKQEQTAPTQQKIKQHYTFGTPQEAKANNGFFVGRGKVGGQFTSLSVAKRKQELIGKDGWLGNPFNKNAKDKRYQIKDNKEGLDKYAKELKDFLLNNDKALDEFLKLQDVTLYKTDAVKNGATEADVVAQLLDALEGKTKSEAKQIIASVTGFKDGVLQFDKSSQAQQEQKEQTNDNNHRDDKVLTPINEAKRILQGKPVASVSKTDVPRTGLKDVEIWAKRIFKEWGNKAVNPVLGEIGLSNNSVNNTLNHGKGLAKFAVFPTLKIVIEQGAIIHHGSHLDKGELIQDFYISAPVDIDGVENVVTVLVKNNATNQNMYLHSVTLKERLMVAKSSTQQEKSTVSEDKQPSKERLLTPLTNQEPQTASSTAQVKATSADIHNILHNLLTDKSQEQIQEKDKSTLFDNLNQQPTKPHNQSGDEIDLDYALADANREANDNRYDDDPFAHLTDEDVKRANEQVEQTKERELQRQADEWELADANDNDDPSSWDNVDDYYQSEEGQQTLKESNQPNKHSLKGKVKVHEQTKEQQDSLTGVQPLSQVIDKLGLSADGLMIVKAINQLYDLKVSFDGTQGKDIIPSDKLLSHLVAYSTSQVLEVLKAEVDDKDLQKLKSDLSIIRQRLAKVKVTDKKYKAMISHALDNDVNLLGLAVSNKDFQNLLKQIEYNESIAKNLFSKLVYGLMSVFGIANKTSVNNLYEKTLTTLGDLIEFQAIDNSSLKAGHLSVLQGVTPSVRQQELQKPVIGETADNYQNLIKAGIYQGVKKPLARIKNLSLKLAQEGLSALKEDITKPTDKQLAQLEHFLAFKEELADLLNQALPKQNYANWDFQDLKEALIRADTNDRIIDDNLITAMALSAYDKIIADGGKTYHSRDDVAKLLGFNPEQVFIPNKVHFEFLHIHAQTPSFSADLGKQIMSALELKQGGDVPSETQDRLASSLGNWLVSALQIGGYVHIITMPVNEVDSYKALVTQESFKENPDNKSTMSFVSFTNVDGENKHDVIDEVIEVSRETGSYLADLFGIPSSKRFPSLKPNKAVKKSIRGTKQKVSSDQERKISQAQQEPIYINQAMNKVLTALGDDVVDKLLGATITEEAVNKLHISRRKGAIEKAQSIKRELDNHREWSAFVGDRPFYDTITTAINNRMHYDSNVWNFQSSTVQRAFGELANFKITIPTQTLELVKDNKPTLQGLFIRAVFENAEGTEDFFKERLKHKYPKGWTVDKIPSVDFMPVALEYINQPYINDAINAILKTQSNDTLTQTDLQAIERVVIEWDMGARSLRALMELGLFSQALSNKTDFVTSLGLGSDGVNNGIAIASVLMGIDDPLTLTQIGLLKQQGFGSYFDTRTDKHIGDYYESFGMELQKAINHAVQALDKEGLVYLEALEYLNNTLKKRATYKAIIIPFGYGAGFKRLKQAAAEQMLGDIISQMQDIYHSKNQADYELLEHHLKVILGNGFKLGGLDKLLEFEFDKKQIDKLLDTHLDFLGEASEDALNTYAGEFIKRRNTAIKLHESASNAFLTAKDMLLDKAQREHQEQVKKQSSSKVQNKALSYATLSDKQLDELEKVLTPIRPKVQNIYSLHSNGENGIQLTKNERSLKDENLVGKTKQLHDGELVNRTTKLLTSFSTEIGNGVTPNSQTVQSTDSYISSEAMVADKTVSINVHDANIANLDHYPKMAQAQNKAFFYGTASYHLGYENIKTVIDTLVGIDKLGLDDKQLQTVFKEALAGFNLEEFGYDKKADPVQALHGILSELIELQLNQDAQKLAMYQSIGVIHQYAGEAGEYVLSEQDYEFLNQEEQKLGGLKNELKQKLNQVFGGESKPQNTKSNPLDKIKNSQSVIVNEKTKIDYELNPKSVLAWAKDNLRGETTINDTNEKITIANIGLKKTLSHDWHNKAHLKSIAVIPELLSNAIFLAQTPADSHKTNAKYETYRYYVVGLKVDNTDYTVRLTVGVDKFGNKFYDHTLTQIEKIKLIDLVDQSTIGFKTMVDKPNHLRANEIKDTKLIELLQQALGQSAVIGDLRENNKNQSQAQDKNNSFDKTTDKNPSQNNTQTNDNNAYTIDKILDKAKFKKRLDTIAQKADNSQKALYEMLFPLLPNNLKFASGTLSNSNAIAGVVGDTIIFTDKLQNLSDTDKLRYINHELIHAVTEYGLSKDSKAKTDLVKMYEQLKAKANTANTQKLTLAFENINEFVAYGLTDKDVQQFILDNLDTKALGIKAPTKIKNALDNFLKAVFSLFGLNKSSNYRAFVGTVGKIIEGGLGKSFEINLQRHSQETKLTDNQLTPKDKAIEILQGKAIASINQTDVDMPRQGGFKAITQWAMGIFAMQGGKANNPVLGDVLLNEQSVRDSLGHGKLNFFKNLAFPLVKDVIEQGAIIAKDTNDLKEESYFISAPVLMDNKPNIITVTVHKDANTQRMYLHSVTMTEKLLVAKKDTHLADRVSEALDDNHRTQNSSQINQVGNQSTIQVSTASSNLDELGSLQNDGLSGSAVTQNTKTYGKNGRISKNHNGSITPSEIHNILHDLLTSKPNIRYAQKSTVDHFKQLDRASISDDFNNHLDKLIDRFISPYDKANITKIDSLASKGLSNTKLLGLGLSTKEAYTTQALTYVFETYFKDNGALSSNRLEDLYKNAQKQFKRIQDLYPDYAQLSPQDKLLARNVYQYVFNNKTKEDNVARFMALVLASENFRQLIDSHKIQKSKENNTWFDKIMLSLQSVLDWFIGAIYASNQSNSKHIQGLLTNLAKLEANSRVTPLDTLQERYEQGFNFTMKPLNKIIKSSLNFAFNNELFINSRFGLLQTVGKAAKFANAPNRDEVASDYVARMQAGLHSNERMSTLMETLNELTLQGVRGKWVDTVTRITQKLGQIRQGVETETHRVLKASIKGEISKTERIAVTRSLLKTDLSSLLTAGFSLNQVINMLDSTKRQTMKDNYITQLKEHIKNKAEFNNTINQVNSLGYYMATGNTSLHYQRNSYNVAKGVGTWYDRPYEPSQDKQQIIDVLATLKALDYANDLDIATLKELFKREPKAMQVALYAHQAMVKKGLDDFKHNPLNYEKGYIAQLLNPFTKVVFVTSQEEQEQLAKQGFEVIGEIDQDPLDDLPKSILMIAKNHHPNNYVSGMLDMYDTSHKGTDIYTARDNPKTIHKIVNAKIDKMKQLAQLDPSQVDPSDTAGAMIANYNADGTIDNYRYEMSSKAKENLLEQDLDYIHVLSAQNANLVYKPEIKKHQADLAKQVINDAKNFNKYPSQYILLDFDSKDKDVQRIMRMIPYPFRQELVAHFGAGNPIPIHNTVYNALFGFKAYSIVEAFDKLNNEYERLNMAERTLVGVFKLMFGKNARQYAFGIERIVQSLMSLIKEMIVVRSGGVLLGNIVQNLWLLAMHGINPLQILKGTTDAWRNSKRYSNDMSRLRQLEVLITTTKNTKQKSAYQRELKTVKARLEQNPMSQFMEAGMMSTIVEDLAIQGETEFKSHYEKKLATLTDKIPDFISKPANFLLINKGSKSFQLLAEATQFSDLAAKYVLTEHIYKQQVKQGVDKDKAMAKAIFTAQESFINYDVPTSRSLDYLNRVGLMVFTKFFLRFQKVLTKQALHNPATAVIMNGLAENLTGTAIYDPFILARLGNNPFDGSVFLLDDALGNLITTGLLF